MRANYWKLQCPECADCIVIAFHCRCAWMLCSITDMPSWRIMHRTDWKLSLYLHCRLFWSELWTRSEDVCVNLLHANRRHHLNFGVFFGCMFKKDSYNGKILNFNVIGSASLKIRICSHVGTLAEYINAVCRQPYLSHRLCVFEIASKHPVRHWMFGVIHLHLLELYY